MTLSECPVSIAVTPANENAAAAAIARARELGLVLPPFITLWVRAPGHSSLAETTVWKRAGSTVHIYIRDDLRPDEVFETMLHELQHAADHALVREAVPTRTLERRADAFACYAQLTRPPLTFEEYLPLFLPRRHA
jgi:hypothetical protein